MIMGSAVPVINVPRTKLGEVRPSNAVLAKGFDDVPIPANAAALVEYTWAKEIHGRDGSAVRQISMAQ